MLANEARGEVLLAIDGAPRKLCLTLGALASLEATFDAVTLAELGERLAALTANDLLLVLAALTEGGGAPMSAADLAHAQICPREAADAVARCFALAFGGDA